MFSELLFIFFAILVVWIIDHLNTLFGAIFFGFTVYYYVNSDSSIINRRCIVLVSTKTLAALSFCFQLAKNMYCFCRQLSSKSEDSSSLSLDSSLQFCGNRASLENEIDVLVSSISQYYIQSWYHKISVNEDFVSYLNSNVKATLANLCTTVSKVDKKKITLIIIQVYLNFFLHFIEAKKKSEVFKRENFEMRHWAMKDNLTELCYLQSLVSTLFDSFCPTESERSLHSKLSPLLHNMLVEILTQNVMQPIVRVLCDPTGLNLLLLKLLSNPVELNETKPGDNECFLKESLPKEESFISKPVILLPNEELYDDSVFVDDQTDRNEADTKPENELFVSDGCNMQKFNFVNNEEFDNDNACRKGPNEYRFGWFNSKKNRSSSNVNLFDAKYSDLEVQDCAHDDDLIYCPIKRSKSADYIRQMPLLKSLNGKDFSIIVESDNRMRISFKSESSKCISQNENAFQFELPTLFTDINITDTYQETEAGSNPYTLYCIQYTGIFHNVGSSGKQPHLSKHVVAIERRFSQFVNLHSSLEANSQLRRYLKRIKGPSKWMFPFTNLDKKNIAERRIFLEKYLRDLCNLAPIAKSAELQDFLSYGKDVQTSPVRKITDINVPRLDKMLVRGVKDAYVMFKTSLPNSSEGDDISLMTRSHTDLYHKFQEYFVDTIGREPDICEHMKNFRKINMQTANCKAASVTLKPKRNSLLRNEQSFEPITTCKCSISNEDCLLEECKFGNVVMELIAVSLKLNDTNFGDPFSLVKTFYAPCINRFLETKLDNFSDDHIITLIHLLHKYLWPEEKNWEQCVTDLENTEVFSKVINNMKAILSSKFTILNLSYRMNEILMNKVSLFLLSFQHQDSNKCLLFHVFDALIEQLCSKYV